MNSIFKSSENWCLHILRFLRSIILFPECAAPVTC